MAVADKLVSYISKISRKTYKKKTDTRSFKNIGSFGSIFDLSSLKMSHPLIVSSTDGVGTKIEIANQIKKRKIRDKAIILIGFSGGFRRSELVNLIYDDVEFVNEGVKIFIKRSKTDQSGEGMTKAIPYFDNQLFCPVVSLKNWMNNSEIKSGKIFDISDKSIALIIKKYASLSGLDPNKYSGHSLRSGFATSTAESGAEERNIMAMTGHKTSQMVRRYIQEANLFKNNALNKIKF